MSMPGFIRATRSHPLQVLSSPQRTCLHCSHCGTPQNERPSEKINHDPLIQVSSPYIYKQPINFRQASNFLPLAIRLKKRQADEGESVTRTSNLREAAPDNQLPEAGSAPPGTESPELDSGKTQAPRGKSSPPASPKAPVPQTVSTKKAPEQPELSMQD
ncbi:hypothetical protein PSTT_00733 [Puccinia striiformis]|uniref:Uncharacterized protein n=1 Tax=Puccinia striiformis TaxID=27350 RepID=A0A2S4W6H9_9BASI|nr:hypothetical protein PSTT_00733 [Puccinia striiformis]